MASEYPLAAAAASLFACSQFDTATAGPVVAATAAAVRVTTLAARANRRANEEYSDRLWGPHGPAAMSDRVGYRPTKIAFHSPLRHCMTMLLDVAMIAPSG